MEPPSPTLNAVVAIVDERQAKGSKTAPPLPQIPGAFQPLQAFIPVKLETCLLLVDVLRTRHGVGATIAFLHHGSFITDQLFSSPPPHFALLYSITNVCLIIIIGLYHRQTYLDFCITPTDNSNDEKPNLLIISLSHLSNLSDPHDTF